MVETESHTACADAHGDSRGGDVGMLGERDLVLRFESLAGTHRGCEFGPAQRAFGVEPLVRRSDCTKSAAFPTRLSVILLR